MASIHLIEKINDFKKVPGTIAEWESGDWKISLELAEELIGGNVYFHRSQTMPSNFGGLILGYRIKTEEPGAGKIILRFHVFPDHFEITTDRQGWGNEKKIVRN